jgi:O-antigen/teichoic acid export membrane protein
MTGVVQKLYLLWQQLKKGILHVFTAGVLNKIISMLSSMVLTRMLVQTQYGVLSYAGNIYSYAALIAGFGLAVGAMQFGTENRGRPEESSFYRYCAKAGSLANLAIIALLSILFLHRELPIAQAKKYVYLYLPLLLTGYLNQLFLLILRSQKRFKTYARLLTVQTIFTSLGTCIGAIWGINGVFAAKYVTSVTALLVIAGLMRETLREIIHGGKLDFRQKKELWRYSILNNVSSTLNRFLLLVDLSMVAALMASAEAIAVYKVATLIPNALSFIPQSVVICVVPDIIAHNKNSTWLKDTFRKTFSGMLLFNLFISLCLILGAPWIIQIVAGKQYLAAVEPFRVLIAGYCVAGTFRSLSVNFLAALKMVKGNAICSLITCVTDVALNLFLIPKYGVLGAACATFLAELTASLITFGCLMYALRRISSQKV